MIIKILNQVIKNLSERYNFLIAIIKKWGYKDE